MDANVIELANLIYGENGGEDMDTMVMTGSSALNRLDADRPQEFGASLPEVIQRGYYAASQNSPMYQQATSGNFPDDKSKLAYKKSLQVAYGLVSGTTPRTEGQFFFKKGEAKSLRKKLKLVSKVGKYDVYSY